MTSITIVQTGVAERTTPVAEAGRARNPLPSDVTSKHWTEPVAPTPYGLVADIAS
jgi:hypothetical protein